LVEEARWEVERLMRLRLSAEALLKTGGARPFKFSISARDCRTAGRMLQSVEEGRVRVELMPGTEALSPTVGNRWASRHSRAMVCALVIGGSLLIQAHIGPMGKGTVVAGLLGLRLALTLGFPSCAAEASRWGL